jgi:hypothetical protein
LINVSPRTTTTTTTKQNLDPRCTYVQTRVKKAICNCNSQNVAVSRQIHIVTKPTKSTNILNTKVES